MNIDPVASTPLYRQMSDDIRRRINAGQWKAGSRLPPYRTLVETYGVSLMTVNKAISALISEGTLHSRVGRGTFVAERPVGPRRHRVLALALPDLSAPDAPVIWSAVRREAAREGYGLVLTAAPAGEEREGEQLERLRDLGIAGLIVSSPDPAPGLIHAVRTLQAEGLPSVLLSPVASEEVPCVGTDPATSGFLATQHLLHAGRRRVGIVADAAPGGMGDLHRIGYLRALQRHGRPHDESLEWALPPATPEDAYDAGRAVGDRIAAIDTRPDALVVCSGSAAPGVLDALLDARVGVPDEVAVVGLGFLPGGERARVPLTTVYPPIREIARLAVDSLVRRLQGERPLLQRRLPPELLVRSSCGTHLPHLPRLVA